MNSMTGYGKGVAERDGRKVTVELKSVNHRFLDIGFKMPRGFQFAEETVRSRIKTAITRGHVDVFVNYENTRADSASVKLNEALASECVDAALKIASMFADKGKAIDGGVPAEIYSGAVEAVMRLPDVLTLTEREEDEGEIVRLIDEATAAAAERLKEMRRSEGERLVEDLRGKLSEIGRLVEVVDARRPQVTANYREKLEKRIAEALGEHEVDEGRLMNEVAFFVDKCNVDEEVTRLKGHLKHYDEILANGGAVGKPLDFLTQEMNREVNTIGSKSNDLEITETVLALKNTVEMVREQIQNLE